jgi:RNA polymerase sigma factor FliA
VQGIDIYEESADTLITEQFVIEYRQLVKKIALHMKRRLPSHIDLEDLMQSGFVGLIEAKKNYKEDMGSAFETFASIRIRGAIIDALRKNSWTNREITKNMRMISDAISRLEQRYQKQPSSEEIAHELGISTEEHMKMCQQISLCNVISLDVVNTDDSLLGNEADNPVELTEREEMLALIKSILTTLPEREQLVLSLYYVEDFTFKQIADILDLTEARICQLHSQAVLRIKSKVKKDVC